MDQKLLKSPPQRRKKMRFPVRPLLAFAGIFALMMLWGVLAGPEAGAQQNAEVGADTPVASAPEAEPAAVPEEFKIRNVIGESVWDLGPVTLDGKVTKEGKLYVNMGEISENIRPADASEGSVEARVTGIRWDVFDPDDPAVPPAQAVILEAQVTEEFGVEVWLRHQPAMGEITEKAKAKKIYALHYRIYALSNGERTELVEADKGALSVWRGVGILMTVIGGLGVFLLGMNYMSEGLQTIAGSRLRRLISMVTNNRLMAVGIGTLVTCIVQSSSVTTVMVVGFVNSGLMTLTQAIGVVMGANIGTTITGWILTLKIGAYGLPILGVAALVFRFSKRDSIRYTAMAVMGVGMIFFGLELMKNGFKPIRSYPEFKEMFTYFKAADIVNGERVVHYWGVLKCAAVGCLLTMIVQSSSATLGITMALAFQGVIPFETAAALVLGENIGTTITAYLASIGTTTNAKRAAYAHCIFNVFGVIWITAIFGLYISLVLKFLPHDPTEVVMANGLPTYPFMYAAIAAVHTGFNVTNTLLFIPLIGIMARFLERVVPDKPHKEAPHLTGLDIRGLETPVIGIEQSRVEVVRMGECLMKMMDKLRALTVNGEPDEALVRKLFHREEVLDIMQKEVVHFLSELLGDELPHEVVNEGRMQLRMADEYESAGDYVADVLKLRMRLQEAEMEFTDEGRSGLVELHDAVADYIKMIHEAYEQRHPDIVSKARTQGEAITHKVRDLREKHLARVTGQNIPPLASVLYTDSLSAYRRVKDHMLNIAEALAGQK